MTLDELYNKLKGITGFTNKIAYRTFNESQAVSLPFAVYYVNTSNNFKADNSVYVNGSNIIVELYTQKKQTATETLFETLFNDEGLVWSKTELYLEDEKCFEIIYNFSIL